MKTIHFAWWNLQNFFDTDDDPISKDFEYTAEKGWTQEVFEAKKANLAQVLNALHGGAGPELLAVAEIEKDALLADLIAEMGNPHLKVVEDRTGTRDLRGIDVAMAYDERKLAVKSKTSHLVHLRYRTRDIFEVVFEVNETGEKLVVIAGHWPSRGLGRYRSEPLRCAVAEHIAYLVEAHVKVEPEVYEQLRAQNDLGPVLQTWETKVVVVGDLNDEPSDRSVVDHLRASHDLDRVIGETNDIDGFEEETADYRGQEVFLFNATWKFLPQQKVGTYFLDSLSSGEKLANRYQVLDQLIASRGLLTGSGLTLDLGSVDIFRDSLVATRSGRPRPFSKKTKKGTSDHLPLTAVLRY
jgi:endonuclease/exonuclease/phosphatase family metal-dependent hydrolase